MVAVNEELLEAALFRSFAQKGISDDIAEKIAVMLREEVLPDIARRVQGLPFNSLKANDFRLIQLKNAIEDGMGWNRVSSALSTNLRDVAVNEAGVTVEQLKSVTPTQLQFITPGPDLLMALVMEKPFNDKLMSEWFTQLGDVVQKDIYRAFRVGMVEGKSIPHMAADLLEQNYEAFSTGGAKKAITNAKAIARTAANLVQNRSREAVYQVNDDIVKGVEYIATLDDRTSFICMDLHGNVYPLGEGERPPQHIQCRSTTVPVLKSWREMGIDQDDLTERQMASMDGRVPKPKSFDSWLKSNDAAHPERANKLLGPVRAKMWREGRVGTVRGFMTDGKKVDLKEFGLNRAGNPLKEIG